MPVYSCNDGFVSSHRFGKMITTSLTIILGGSGGLLVPVWSLVCVGGCVWIAGFACLARKFDA